MPRPFMGESVDIEMIDLEPGARPPEAADWISIEALGSDRYNVAGCVAGEQMLVFANEMFESVDEAALAGAYWARHRGAKVVYVERLT